MPEPDRPGRALQAHVASSGELLWRKEIKPSTAATEPLLVDGVALVAGGPLIAYDARSGTRLWTLEDAPVQVQAAGDLVVLSREREVQAVEARTGRSLWRRPTAPGERLFAGPGGIAVLSDRGVRLLGPDGEQVWQVALAEPLQAHPGAGLVAVAGLRGDVLGLDAADGSLRWRARTPPADVVLVAGDRVLARTASDVLALGLERGEQLWRQQGPGSGGPLQVAGHRVLVVEHGGTSRVLALADGEVLDEPQARDVELLTVGLISAEFDELRFESASRGWTASVATGDRPALWTGTDDDVVVAVVGWGQPPAQD